MDFINFSVDLRGLFNVIEPISTLNFHFFPTA